MSGRYVQQRQIASNEDSGQQKPGESRQAYIDRMTTAPKRSPVPTTIPPTAAAPPRPVEGPALAPDKDPAGTARWRAQMEAKERDRVNGVKPSMPARRPIPTKPIKPITPPPTLAAPAPTVPPKPRTPRFSDQ